MPTEPRDLESWIGRTVRVPTSIGYLNGHVRVDMTVTHVKVSFGVPRLLVRPVSGVGDAWINLETVTREG